MDFHHQHTPGLPGLSDKLLTLTTIVLVSLQIVTLAFDILDFPRYILKFMQWNLDKVHKTLEMAGAIAVVISLIFVGLEIQQNNEIQRQMATQSLVRDWSNAVEAYQDPELSCLWLRLMTDKDNLTGQEANQIETVLWRIYKVYEEFHYQHGRGMVDELVWSGFRNTNKVAVSSDGFRAWWQAYRGTFGSRFQKYLDELIATTPLNPKPYFSGITCDTAVGEQYWITG
jgi:hypothetical protein